MKAGGLWKIRKNVAKVAQHAVSADSDDAYLTQPSKVKPRRPAGWQNPCPTWPGNRAGVSIAHQVYAKVWQRRRWRVRDLLLQYISGHFPAGSCVIYNAEGEREREFKGFLKRGGLRPAKLSLGSRPSGTVLRHSWHANNDHANSILACLSLGGHPFMIYV